MMRWRHRIHQPGVLAALGAALLFGAGTPLAKLLLDTVNLWLLAGLLLHTWAPEQPESLQHLMRLDELMGAAVAAAPDAAFLLTADHGMNYKTQCWDLTRICEEAGVPIRFALSPERDYYIRHHRNFTGCSWVWLHAPGDCSVLAAI